MGITLRVPRQQPRHYLESSWLIQWLIPSFDSLVQKSQSGSPQGTVVISLLLNVNFANIYFT